MSTRYVWEKYDMTTQIVEKRETRRSGVFRSGMVGSDHVLAGTGYDLDKNGGPFPFVINGAKLFGTTGPQRPISASQYQVLGSIDGGYTVSNWVLENTEGGDRYWTVGADFNSIFVTLNSKADYGTGNPSNLKDYEEFPFTYITYESQYGKGDLLRQVSSQENYAYPTDGASGSNWYTFKGTDSIDAASISYPSSANAGDTVTVTVSPGAGNKFGGSITYRFEYSTDGGGTWHTAAQTKNTSILYTVPAAKTLRFRVQASDDTGFTSNSYTTGADMSVINNTAPYPPRSITVEPVTAGVDVSISWEEAVDPDGTIFNYTLMRAVDGGSFRPVYTGTALSYTDKSDNRNWAVVQYQVKAVDNQGYSSGWTASPVMKVQASGITFPDGGRLEQFENSDGKPVFPLTVMEGIFRRSDGKSLAAVLSGISGGSAGEKGEPGPGVPAGGETGQMLVKRSADDYDTHWVDPPEGGGETEDFSDLIKLPGGGEMSIPAAFGSAPYTITVTQDDESASGVTMEQVDAAIAEAVRNYVASATVSQAQVLTEAEYTALAGKDAKTLYLIKE